MKVAWATPSRIFLAFWLCFLAGLIVGNYYTLPSSILVWFGTLWLIILWSKQEPELALLAASLAGVSAGFLLWQQTGGNAWLHSAYLAGIAESLQTVRDSIVAHIYVALPEPHGSLLAGIIFGNKLPLDQTLVKDFRAVGLSHVVAVSGYNLTIITANITSIFKPTVGRSAAYISLVAIIIFVLITGAPASILRAAVMAVFLLLAQLTGRPARSVNILVLATGLLAVFQPNIITDVGFQLSVAATYGLLRLTPLLELGLRKLLPVTVVRQVLSETLAATVVTAPIIITTFAKFSFISPLSNILVLPTIPLVMGLGIVGCAVSFITPALGHFVLFLSYPVLAWIVYITHLLATSPVASTGITLSVAVAVILTVLLVAGTELGNYFLAKQLSEPINEQ